MPHDPRVLTIAFGQLYDAVHVTSLRDLLETTKDYCQSTGQDALLKRQNWYQFWRIVRNCFSHDSILRFRKNDKKYLPVTWNGLTLDESREGTYITHGEFPRERFWLFLDELRLFGEKDLV